MRINPIVPLAALSAGVLLASTALADAGGFRGHMGGYGGVHMGGYGGAGHFARPAMGYGRTYAPARHYGSYGYGYGHRRALGYGVAAGLAGGYAAGYASSGYASSGYASSGYAEDVDAGSYAGSYGGGYGYSQPASGSVYAVPHTVYTPVTQTHLVRVTSYQAVQTTHVVPHVVYEHRQRVCSCHDVSLGYGGYHGGYGYGYGGGYAGYAGQAYAGSTGVIYNRPGLFTSSW
jgi:hypothetical protein